MSMENGGSREGECMYVMPCTQSTPIRTYKVGLNLDNDAKATRVQGNAAAVAVSSGETAEEGRGGGGVGGGCDEGEG